MEKLRKIMQKSAGKLPGISKILLILAGLLILWLVGKGIINLLRLVSQNL
jgi:hypothetical protein